MLATLLRCVESIGKAVEQECQMSYYEQQAPGLLHILKENYWHSACGTQQKFVNIRLMMNRNNITWDKWPPDVRVKLGGWLLECVINTSGWFEDLTYEYKVRRQTCIVPSASFMDIKDQLLREAEALSAFSWPMLVKPREWTNEAPGGYLFNEVMLGHDMVRGDGHPIQGETPLEFLNELQATAYQVNPFVYSVARA
jgi:DNA-directed RNA polymerase